MNIKKITSLAILLALNTSISLLDINIMGNYLRISFTFLIAMLICTYYSYSDCVIYAVCEDLLGFLISNASRGDVFFPGYTLSAVLSFSIYYLFLHKSVNIKTVTLAKLTNNLLVNVLIGSLWRTILYSKGYIFYASSALIKNIIILPIEVALFLVFYRYVKPIFNKFMKEQ